MSRKMVLGVHDTLRFSSRSAFRIAAAKVEELGYRFSFSWETNRINRCNCFLLIGICHSSFPTICMSAILYHTLLNILCPSWKYLSKISFFMTLETSLRVFDPPDVLSERFHCFLSFSLYDGQELKLIYSKYQQFPAAANRAFQTKSVQSSQEYPLSAFSTCHF